MRYLFSLFCFVVFSLSAQQAQKKPCQSEPYRQFQFWLGEWTVMNKDSTTLLGHSKITSMLDSCAIFEDWTSSSGTYRGNSINYYDRVSKKWHQKWIDNQGGAIEFSGIYRNKQLLYEGQSTTSNGSIVYFKLTFTYVSEILVRQFWEQSTDNKQTWTSIFDGYYHRKI